MNSWTNKRLSLLQALREGMLKKNAMRSGGSEAKLDSSLALRRAEEVAGAPAPKSEEACGGVHHAYVPATWTVSNVLGIVNEWTIY